MRAICLMLVLATTTATAREVDTGAPLNIVNGDEEPGFPSTMSLGLDLGGRQSTCTASLITPELLLTASHCTEEYIKMGFPRDGVIQVSRVFPSPDVQDGPAYRVADIINHPEYVSDNGGGKPKNDWGVVILEEPVTDVEPVWINTTPLDDETTTGTELVSVGYGITDAATQRGAGTRRSVPILVSNVQGQFLESLTQQNPTQGNLCSGDSGGPQYHIEDDGRVVQWAVHSWADQTCQFLSGSSRTDKGAEFILGVVNDVHGTTDFCEITGRYGDGACDTWCEAEDPDCGSADGGDGSGGGGEGKGCGGCASTGGLGWGPWMGLGVVLGRRRRG